MLAGAACDVSMKGVQLTLGRRGEENPHLGYFAFSAEPLLTDLPNAQHDLESRLRAATARWPRLARDDQLPGLRTIGFERRATIAFIVTADAVLVARRRADGPFRLSAGAGE